MTNLTGIADTWKKKLKNTRTHGTRRRGRRSSKVGKETRYSEKRSISSYKKAEIVKFSKDLTTAEAIKELR